MTSCYPNSEINQFCRKCKDSIKNDRDLKNHFGLGQSAFDNEVTVHTEHNETRETKQKRKDQGCQAETGIVVSQAEYQEFKEF
jgi:hypothetical protein